ncbi:MAG TPA: FAD-dependent monooxygenase [Candidatus Nanopelagicales bacterium]|nr:FAD-dependent monooxygenase [Candidatus Nanopelagicales bacterium]
MVRYVQDKERLRGRRAAVIGGSMAGLLAARVLSDHFDEVTIIERDPLPIGTEERRGVPQARHAHALLARGLDVLSELFPGVLEELAGEGAERVDFGTDIRWQSFGTWKVSSPSGIRCSFQSRALLESVVRRRARSLPGIHLRDGCRAAGLVMDPSGRRLTGVRIEGPASDEVIPAELVVDASGRGSPTPAWLEALGYAAPEVSAVKVHVGYSSRIFRRPEPVPGAWKVLYLLATAPVSRAGVIFPIEGGRWMVTLIGLLRDYPPHDDAGFLEFARGLPSDELYHAIRGAEPLGGIASHRFASHQWRRYERAARLPEGLCVLGDALCSFNPIYGQGMTTGALAALTLDGCLREQRRSRGPGSLDGLTTAFHARVAEMIEMPWRIATGEDLRFPEVEGERTRALPLLNWYAGHVHALCGYDPEVTARFYRVQHMLARPRALLHPRVALAVLRRYLGLDRRLALGTGT